ncbi:HlyD family type I secretion periplasmic adaptor subunit [Methylobacterium sp. 22177]|uniref:HlyD family type I secretion periplasmic adaptor subunit n=1 Tax=Methylobacterium sp. 22177 TaxID=3453885 RepID=UPI003F82F813
MTLSAQPANQNGPSLSGKVVRFERRYRQHRRDQEFLPAALEILESPPSPVRMVLILIICALAATALVWAYIGHIDVVALAQGKIQPTGRVKVVQPLESGRVRLIQAENGLHVSAGDILVELDPTEMHAEEVGLRTNLIAYRAETVRRREAIQIASESNLDSALFARPALTFGTDTPSSIRMREQQVLTGDLAQLGAAVESLIEQTQQKIAERDRLIAMIAAQKNLISTLKERVEMRTILVEKSAGTKSSLIDATETLQYQQGTLATQIGQLAEAEASLRVLTRERRKLRDTFIADNGQRLADAERQVDDLEQRLAKARARTEHMTLRAPLTGTVQASSLTTIGQVVMPGEELMRIVPDGSVLEVEAYLPNRDIGFVQPGQEATIKIESFPFTRYGTITGYVTRVASDAIPEPEAQQTEGSPTKSLRIGGFIGGAQRTQNLVFPIIVRPEVTNISADGVSVPLSPGMAVSIEIKTGKRRILEYLFSPFLEVTSRAMHER